MGKSMAPFSPLWLVAEWEEGRIKRMRLFVACFREGTCDWSPAVGRLFPLLLLSAIGIISPERRGEN